MSKKQASKNNRQTDARRHVKPNRINRVRQKDWQRATDEVYTPRRERMMRRGERERRAMVQAQALATLDAVDDENIETVWADAAETGALGMVLEVSSSLCRVAVNGNTLLCKLRGSLTDEDTGFTNIVTVGDRVLVTEHGEERGIVDAVMPRRSALSRPDPFYRHRKQVIVANADTLLIVASWLEPPLWHELIDRYLIVAERNRLAPVICVNKMDLAEDHDAVRTSVAPYTSLGYRVLFASAVTGEGIDDLRALLRDQTTVLAGLSGVGKSSLLAAAEPGLDLRTGAVSTHWGGQGQHTTTQVNLFSLREGGYVVDTPGIRELAISGLSPLELLSFYPRIEELTGQCRFANCTHSHEPGCAVKAALRAGQLSPTRYKNYRQILSELEG